MKPINQQHADELVFCQSPARNSLKGSSLGLPVNLEEGERQVVILNARGQGATRTEETDHVVDLLSIGVRGKEKEEVFVWVGIKERRFKFKFTSGLSRLLANLGRGKRATGGEPTPVQVEEARERHTGGGSALRKEKESEQGDRSSAGAGVIHTQRSRRREGGRHDVEE